MDDNIVKTNFEWIKESLNSLHKKVDRTNGSVRDLNSYKENVIEPVVEYVDGLRTEASELRGVRRYKKWIAGVFAVMIIGGGLSIFRMSVKSMIREENKQLIEKINASIKELNIIVDY